MKRLVPYVIGACLAGAPAAALAQAAPAADASPLTAAALMQFKLTSGNVVKAAEKMPEDQYGFKPAPEVRNFGAILAHVANTNYMICSRAAGGENPSKDDFEKTTTAKASLVKALNESFAYCEGVFGKVDDRSGSEMVEFFGRQQPKLAVLWFNTVHNFEHYGNLVTYMRMKGLVPPTSERASGGQ